MSNHKIAAIVPAFNEERSVGNILSVLSDSNIFDEIILVDDGSEDKTAEVGKNFNVKIIRKKENSGKADAMMEGVLAADADVIAFFDADLVGLNEKHVKSLVGGLLNSDASMCIGVRERMFGLPRLIAKIDPLMAIGGERILRKDLFLALPKKLAKGFQIEILMNNYCKENNLKVSYVILNGLNHAAKENKYGFVRGVCSRIKMIFQIINIRLIILFNKNGFK